MTTGSEDLVSVVIPVHNGIRFLAECLSSAAGQVGAALEILVVDDGSEDGSGDMARAYPGIRVIRRKKGGVGAARNTGIEEARGRSIAFLDADDIWHPEKTARQLAALRAHPDTGGVLCRFRNFLDPVHPHPAGLDRQKFLENKTGDMPSLVTLLAERKTLEKVGPFRTDLVTGEDLDWFARAADSGVSFFRMPETLVERRLHDTNLSYRSRKDCGHLIEIMRASIQRKRASEPRISVVIPVHNHGRYLGEAIESVLNQTFPAAEIIVVDGSTDDTAGTAKSFLPKIKYLYREPGGIGDARNAGIETSQGDFIAHLDADDIWLPDKLAVQIEAFSSDPERELVGGCVKSFFSPELGEDERLRIHCPADPLPGLAASALLVKREVYDRVGLYETHWRLGSDLNWLTRVREAGLETFIVPQVVVRRRLHAENTGLRDREFARERVRVLKMALDRKRSSELGRAAEKTNREKE